MNSLARSPARLCACIACSAARDPGAVWEQPHAAADPGDGSAAHPISGGAAGADGAAARGGAIDQKRQPFLLKNLMANQSMLFSRQDRDTHRTIPRKLKVLLEMVCFVFSQGMTQARWEQMSNDQRRAFQMQHAASGGGGGGGGGGGAPGA